MKRYLPKLIPAALLALLYMLAPSRASAGITSITGFLGGAIGDLMFGLGYIISTIFGVVITFETWLISLILKISVDIVNSPIVQTGFSASLSFANLGFVFAVILMGFATVVRWKTYLVQSMLPTLVLMAITVNFGLVIGGAILNFSNSMTVFLLDSISPSKSLDQFDSFASAMSGAFQPNRLFTFTANPNASNQTGINGIQGSQAAKAAADIGSIIPSILGVFFTIFVLVVIVITLATFISMLLYRYLKLSFAFILLPFAWLANVFPSQKSHFSKWWSDFFKQAFFPPISLFFLWLALLVAYQMYQNNKLGGTQFTDVSDPNSFLGIGNVAGGFLVGFAQSALYNIVIAGLMVGGMFVADKLGTHGASAGMKAITTVKDGMIGAAKRYTGRVAEPRLRRMGENKATGKLPYLQRLGNRLQSAQVLGVGIPGAATLGSALARGSQVPEGYGKDVDAYAKSELSNLSKEALFTRARSATAKLNTVEAAALAKTIAEKGWIDEFDAPQKASPEEIAKKQETLKTAKIEALNAQAVGGPALKIAQEKLTKAQGELDTATGRGVGSFASFVPIAAQLGVADEIYAAKPELSPAYKKLAETGSEITRKSQAGETLTKEEQDAIKDFQKMIAKAKDASKLLADTFGDAEKAMADGFVPTIQQVIASLSLTAGEIQKIGTDGNEKQKSAVQHTVEYIMAKPEALPIGISKDSVERIRTYINKNAYWQSILTKEEREKEEQAKKKDKAEGGVEAGVQAARTARK